jgi:cysteinyl-tRNA synthetase
MKLYNSLSRKIEEFKPVNPPNVTMYTCGPTVYDYQHIGNLRTATLMDLLNRVLKANKYNVKSVMNITDVEDKIEKKAAELGVTVDEITSKYEKIYMDQLAMLNISADLYPHATGHILEQIELIKVLEQKGFTYKTDYGIYFDTSKDSDYGKLGNTFNSDKGQSRIELTEGKRNAEDFALWKYVLPTESRQKTWDSPWGVGFPGWHIECSAMSMKSLTNAFGFETPLSTPRVDIGFVVSNFSTIDIHVGGEDLKEIHHENELAQTESITDKTFINYWVHGAMLNVDETKMSKSLNNFVTLQTVIDKGFEPMALRYFYYSAHYRSELKFSWEGLKAAQSALYNLSEYIDLPTDLTAIEQNMYSVEFVEKLNDDLNVPQALAVLFNATKDESLQIDEKKKIVTYAFEVLGLSPINNDVKLKDLPKQVVELMEKREALRKSKDFLEADKIRGNIKELGYEILDGEELKIKKV